MPTTVLYPLSLHDALPIYPAALFENAVRACVELRGRLVHRQRAVDGALRHHAHLRRDALPFGHLGRRLDALELLAERARVDVVREAAVVPRRAPWRQVTGERVEPPLHRGLREELDELPRRRLMARLPEDDE